MLTIKAIAEGKGLRAYYFIHPPLYILFSSLITYLFGDSHRLVQLGSILFSVLALIPLYLITESIINRRTALLTILIICLMPSHIIFSTWVKPEPMLLFFFLWSLYFFIKRKPYGGGVFFGIALLTKEFAAFLVPIVLCLALTSNWGYKESIKLFLKWFISGVLISGWWYALYGTSSFNLISSAAVGGNLFEFSWHYPWHYYIDKMASDFSAVILLFLAIGFLSLIRVRCLFPLLWILFIYVPLSLVKVKTPWYIYLALPAIATVAAVGFLSVWKALKRFSSRSIFSILVGVTMLIALSQLEGTAFYEYQLGRKVPVNYDKVYIKEGRKLISGAGKVAMLDYNPTLQYYLDIADERFFYLGTKFPGLGEDMIKKMAETYGIEWFVIDVNSVNYLEHNLESLGVLWGNPDKIGDLLFYRALD